MDPRWAGAGSAGCTRRACACRRAPPRGSSRRGAAPAPPAAAASPAPSTRARARRRGTVTHDTLIHFAKTYMHT